MPAAFEISAEKDLENGLKTRFGFLGGQAADLSVIMQAGTLGGKGVVALGRPDALDFIGGDAHTDTGAADQDTPIELTPDDGFGHLHGDIRIVHGVFRIAAEVVPGKSLFIDYPDYILFKRAPPMVTTDSDTHGYNLLFYFPDSSSG
jgi:hypothetical protein